MASLVDPVAAVSQQVEDFFTAQREQTAGYGPEAARMLDAAAAAVAGGKRLRARFCLTGYQAVSEVSTPPVSTPESAVIGAAAALEVFHAAALVHDDIIDNSDTRRGRPSAHRRIENAHLDAGWRGDAAAFGRAAGILLGDLLVALSDDLLETALSTAPDTRAAAARRQYAMMRRDVTIGQFLDIAEESAHVTAPDTEHAERALRVASLKSARYSVEQPLLIGARLAGADQSQLRALAEFGHPVGMAFQLRDDVLGVFGDEHETGKPAGDDLREGKRTVLIAYAREALSPGTRRLIDELIGDVDLDAGQVASLQRTIQDTGALDRVEDLIAGYVRTADRALAGARLGNAAVGHLRDLARAAAQRTS
ncbi:polyprenyl synthetase family protein [Microbacterium protaetiae]|uniref:Polyprenyl synthetase family protein n=1 Tax=Microbacterium protaetiae TaxID=2509458 RepID=A0A4P6EGL1_9MICO|nr:polyprenyl synthetase family protein [Microbacterium protaetiae]QAY61600.1 polyprenyl synthetase family protein [Microbacterium protaetiae]